MFVFSVYQTTLPFDKLDEGIFWGHRWKKGEDASNQAFSFFFPHNFFYVQKYTKHHLKAVTVVVC